MKVLISDNLSELGVKVFQETPGIEVDVNTGLSPEELKKIIGQYDGLVIRSATKVTADIIEAAAKLSCSVCLEISPRLAKGGSWS